LQSRLRRTVFALAADLANAPGWRDAGKTGDKAECLKYIASLWTDMRPLSLRKKMAEESGV
jgi:MbtH protein